MVKARLVVPLLLLVVAVLATRPALAASAEEKAKARELYQSGLIHYDLGEFPQALAAFKDAYRLVQDPAFLYNIAQCHRRLGQNAEALDFYRNYLRRSPSAPNRGEVERRIQEIERDIQAGRGAHPAAPPPPKETAPPPAPIVAPPPRPLEPTPAPPPAPPTVSQPSAAPPPASVDLTAPPPAEKEGSGAVYTRWWFWAGIGAVVVGGLAVGLAVSQRGEIGNCRDLTGTMCRTVGN